MLCSNPLLGNKSAAWLGNHLIGAQYSFLNLIRRHLKTMPFEYLKLTLGMGCILNAYHTLFTLPFDMSSMASRFAVATPVLVMLPSLL